MADVDEKLRSFSEHEDAAGTPPITTLKLDQHGFPLRPQPSDDPKGEILEVLTRVRCHQRTNCHPDPLNWNRWLKFFTLLQVAFLAFLGPFTQAYIVSPPPSFLNA